MVAAAKAHSSEWQTIIRLVALASRATRNKSCEEMKIQIFIPQGAGVVPDFVTPARFQLYVFSRSRVELMVAVWSKKCAASGQCS